jgi:hypothetical protein
LPKISDQELICLSDYDKSEDEEDSDFRPDFKRRNAKKMSKHQSRSKDNYQCASDSSFEAGNQVLTRD